MVGDGLLLTPENSARSGRRQSLVFRQFDHLAFGDASNLIEVKPALALSIFGINRRTKKHICNHRATGNCGTGDNGNGFPIGNQAFQRSDPQRILIRMPPRGNETSPASRLMRRQAGRATILTNPRGRFVSTQ
jgi:hypothetical protein